MQFFKHLLTFYFIIFASTLITADVVSGKCPRVTETTFNCSDAVPNSTRPSFDPKLLIYGFLPSSPLSKTMNLFGFDLKSVSISNYYILLLCNKTRRHPGNFFNVKCGDNQNP